MVSSYVVIGDGIAGHTAAATLREGDPDAEITILTDEGEALYNRILIKEYAKGKLPEGPISMRDPEWYANQEITLELDTLVIDVDPDEHIVRTADGRSFGYDKLLIASGGTPKQLPVENAAADGIHQFWTFEDARRIKAHAEQATKAVVVGAGLIGVDFAGVCGAHNLETKYLMRGQYWWRYALSPTGAELVHDGLRELGVDPVFESGVERFEVNEEGHVTAAIDPQGRRFATDIVGVGIGLDENVEFLQETEAKLDNGIVVDEYMRSSLPDIYAAGDVTTFYDTITDSYEKNGSWDSAQEQGAVAAHNMIADEPVDTFEFVSTYSVTHFEFPFLSIGHPTKGDDYIEASYDDNEWRRIALADNQIVGAVLIGDLAPQNAIKQLMTAQQSVDTDRARQALLAPELDPEALAPVQEQ